MTTWHEWSSLADAALHGMAQPWIICVVLVSATFVLEDLAIAAGAAVAVQGSLSWELAFAAVAGGIALGDLGLYALGLAARRLPFLRRQLKPPAQPLDAKLSEAVQENLGAARRFTDGQGPGAWVHGQLRSRLGSAVLLARVIPGLRFLTYTACGLFRLPFWPFFAWVLLAVVAWTAGLLWVAALFGAALASALGIPAPLAVALPIVVLAFVLAGLRRNKRAAERRLA